MQIDKRLNLVIILARADEDDETDGTPPLYVHCAPLLLETVKTYHMVLAKTFSALMSERLSITAGPSVAAYTLEEVAKNTYRSPGVNWWDGFDGVEAGLLSEMRRLANVISVRPDGAGWGLTPLQVAIDGQPPLISPDEAMEVLNQIAFFTVISAIAPAKDRPKLIRGAAYLFDGQTSLSNCTEFLSSLKTLTMDENSGEKNQTVSVPH
jgi:hypothetical protein